MSGLGQESINGERGVAMNDYMPILRERWSDALLTALTGLLVVMLFVIAPLQALGIFLFQAFELFFAIILVAGVFVLSGSRTAVAAMVVALLMATIGAIFRIKAPSILDINLFAGSWLIMGITMGVVVSRAVFAPGRVTHHHVMGAVLLYLTIAITFVALFTFIGSLVPKAFSGLSLEDSPALASNLIYFSFATLTTTGYGDIFPVHPIARSLCNLESIFGQLYPATLLARLVTLELAGRHDHR
jgi:Ion channel